MRSKLITIYVEFHDYAGGYGIELTDKKRSNWENYTGTEFYVNGQSIQDYGHKEGRRPLYPLFSTQENGYAAEKFLAIQLRSTLSKLNAIGLKTEISAHSGVGGRNPGFILKVTNPDGSEADQTKVHEIIGNSPVKISTYKVGDEKQYSNLANSLTKGIGLGAQSGSTTAAAATNNPNPNQTATAKK